MRKRWLVLGALIAIGIVAWLATPTGDATMPTDRPAPTVGTVRHDESQSAREKPPRSGAPAADVAPVDASSPTRNLSGRVVDASSGAPITGASVGLARARPRWKLSFLDQDVAILDLSDPARPDGAVTTGADGSFTLPVTDEPPRKLVARADGYTAATADIPETGPVEVQLAPEARRRFVVLAQIDRRPIPQAEVVVYAHGFLGPPLTRVVADAGGKVDVPCADGDSLLVRAERFATSMLELSEVADEVLLESGFGLAGGVVDSQGRPVAGAEVLVSSGWSSIRVRAVTDAAGRFAFDGLAANEGEQDVEVEHPDFIRFDERLATGEADARIVLSRPCCAEGHVFMPDGSPAVGATVEGHWTTGPDGAFRAGPFESGERRLGASWRPAGSSVWPISGAARVLLRESETVHGVEIRLVEPPRSFVTVRLLDAEGRPVKDPAIEGHLAASPVWEGGRAALTLAVAPGTPVKLAFHDRSDAIRFREIVVDAVTRAAAEGPDVDVRLPSLPRFVVRVRMPEDAGPPPHALLREGPQLLAAESRSDGEFAWRVDPAAEHVVQYGAEGFPYVSRPLTPAEVASGRVEVTVAAGATVRLRVVSDDPLAVKDANATLDVAGGGTSTGALWFDEPGDGVRERIHVPPGAAKLRVLWPGEAEAAVREFVVPASGVVDLGTFRIPAMEPLSGVVRGPGGAPVAGVKVTFHDPEEDGSTVTHEDGSFAIRVPGRGAGGRGALRFSKHGLGTVVRSLDGVDARRPMVVDLRPGVPVRLVWVAPRDRGHWSMDALLRSPDGAAQWRADGPDLDREWDDDARSRMRFEGRALSAGCYVARLRLHNPDRTIDREFTVPETGLDATLDFDAR